MLRCHVAAAMRPALYESVRPASSALHRPVGIPGVASLACSSRRSWPDRCTISLVRGSSTNPLRVAECPRWYIDALRFLSAYWWMGAALLAVVGIFATFIVVLGFSGLPILLRVAWVLALVSSWSFAVVLYSWLALRGSSFAHRTAQSNYAFKRTAGTGDGVS